MTDTTPLYETLTDRQVEAMEAGRFDYAALLQERMDALYRLEVLMNHSDKKG